MRTGSLLLVLWGLLLGAGAAHCGELKPWSGGPAPALSLRDPAGATYDLAAYRGKVVLVNFWASWCAPCREEAPVIERLWHEYRERGYTFVGVNILDTERDARAFAIEERFTFPVVRDVEGAVYLDYGVYGIPEAFFLRPGQLVNEKFNGALGEPEFRAMLDSLEEAS
jgi:cytochrome c biogenesis protein CcmG/thiol:disulfide interchange protein DsbE